LTIQDLPMVNIFNCTLQTGIESSKNMLFGIRCSGLAGSVEKQNTDNNFILISRTW